MKRADTCAGAETPTREWALTGPSVIGAGGQMPIRGDLAHIRLAGLHFVPHYAAPMPHSVAKAGAAVRAAPDPQSEVRAQLQPGARFAVLDIAADWAWGQAERDDGEDGAVGYVILDELERTPS